MKKLSSLPRAQPWHERLMYPSPQDTSCLEIDASKYRVVGDTYIEGIMFGEARTWEESEADDIVLV